MLLTGVSLVGFVKRLINAFKSRVSSDSGTFESEACLNTQINSLRALGLYDKARLIITPNAYKAGKIYALKPINGSGDLTFARAGVGSRRNSVGTFESLANNVPALNYPIGGGCPSWLSLPQRTNIFLNPESPATQNITVTAGQVYTVTTFGTVTATCSGAGTGVASNNGSFTFTASTTTLTVTISGISGQAYVNCGLGAVAWTVPVMSGASATTRIADSYSLNLASLVGVPTTEGCLFVDYNPLGFGIETSRIITLTTIDLNNRIFLAFNANNTVSVFVRNTAGIVFSGTTAATQLNGWNKIAFNYTSGSSQIWLNGVQIFSDSSPVSFAASFQNLFLATLEATQVAQASIMFKHALLFPNKLSNSEVQTLTTL